MKSLTFRYSLLMFLLITATVLMMTYFANQQMDTHFLRYLYEQRVGTAHSSVAAEEMLHVIGPEEREFLATVHNSLIWVGVGMMVVGLFASYVLGRDITIPLRNLNTAVQAVAKGSYGQQVTVTTSDEVGELARAFNVMSHILAENHWQRKRLFADIAHEMKTPLAILQGNLEGILDGVIKPTEEQIQSLYEETVHLSRIITDLRDLSLAEAGQLVLEQSATDINALVARSIQLLQRLAEDKKVTLALELQPIPAVEVDPDRIIQVVYNLLTNAIRYTPAGGTVIVKTTVAAIENKTFAQIAVEDTGIGIAKEDLPFVFNHFFRADSSRDRKSGGAGLGLAIVKQLVEGHGGFVRVMSEPGVGSRFIVNLRVDSQVPS